MNFFKKKIKKKVSSYISITKTKRDSRQKHFIELFAEDSSQCLKYIAYKGMPINVWWGLESWPSDSHRNVD